MTRRKENVDMLCCSGKKGSMRTVQKSALFDRIGSLKVGELVRLFTLVMAEENTLSREKACTTRICLLGGWSYQ